MNGNIHQLATARMARSTPPRPLPGFTWDQLERQLVELATPDREELARMLVRTARLQAATKTPEMLLREILCLAWTLLDEDPCDAASRGEGASPG